jgi:hypothetical protein
MEVGEDRMVEGVSAGGHVGVMAITALRYAQSDGVDLIMPVRPAQQVFANFRHIQVLPDFRLQDGVPLYKLKILDALIDSLSRADGTGGGAAVIGAAGKRAAVTAASVDKTIESLFDGIRTGKAGTPSYRAGFLPEPGAFIDLVA